MKLPSDFSTAKAYDGSALQQITPGGHICRIRAARLEKAVSGKDKIVVLLDVEENGEFDGYYQQKFNRSRQYNADARWPGKFQTTILNNAGQTMGYFKGLIDAVEQSNPGFNFVASGADETKLAGKLVGFVFGEEEYVNQYTGEIAINVKPRYAVSVQKIREGVQPPPLKKLGKDQQAAAEAQTGQSASYDDDDLPF